MPPRARHAHREVTPVPARLGRSHGARAIVGTRRQHVSPTSHQRDASVVEVGETRGRARFHEHEHASGGLPGGIHHAGPCRRREFPEHVGANHGIGRRPGARRRDVGQTLGHRHASSLHGCQRKPPRQGQERATSVHLHHGVDGRALRERRPGGRAGAGSQIRAASEPSPARHREPWRARRSPRHTSPATWRQGRRHARHRQTSPTASRTRSPLEIAAEAAASAWPE